MTDVVAQPMENTPDEVLAATRGRHLIVGEVITLYALSIAAAMALAAILVASTGGSATAVLQALLDGSLLNPGRWGLTLGAAAPLLLVALGTIVSSRAGLVNIGQEGQLLMGSAFATFVGTKLGLSGPMVILMLCVAGIFGGAIWAAIAAALRFWRNVPEVLTTLLMVTIAAQAVGYGLRSDWLLLAPAGDRANRNQVSAQLDDATRLPRVTVFGNESRINIAAVLWKPNSDSVPCHLYNDSSCPNQNSSGWRTDAGSPTADPPNGQSLGSN